MGGVLKQHNHFCYDLFRLYSHLQSTIKDETTRSFFGPTVRSLEVEGLWEGK